MENFILFNNKIICDGNFIQNTILLNENNIQRQTIYNSNNNNNNKFLFLSKRQNVTDTKRMQIFKKLMNFQLCAKLPSISM